MEQKLRRLFPVISLLLFVVAVWILHRELSSLRLSDVTSSIQSLEFNRFFLAMVFTAISYLLLTAYDVLGFYYQRSRIAYPKVAFVAFVGYAFNNAVGHAMLTGLPIRVRWYPIWGIRIAVVLKLVAFGLVTYWLGFLALGSLAFSFSQRVLPEALPFPFDTLRPLGWLLLIPVVAYLAATFWRRKSVRLGNFEIEVPRPSTALAQIVLASIDVMFTAAVLHMLLPAHPELSFYQLLTYYLLAQLAGLASQVPAGLGVFETVIVVLAAPPVETSAVVAGLVLFRLFYYLLPLALAALMVGAFEFSRRRE